MLFFNTIFIFQPQGLCEKTPQLARAGILNPVSRLATLGRIQYATCLGEFEPTEPKITVKIGCKLHKLVV